MLVWHIFKHVFSLPFFPGVVHENPQIGSDGESEEGSRHSEDVVSPASVASAPNAGGGGGANGSAPGATGAGATTVGGVRMRQKPGGPPRKVSSQEEINKRLSLPADLKLPENFVEKLAVSPTLDGPLTRATRRQSLSEIGFGRMDTYTKLDKLGEVGIMARGRQSAILGSSLSDCAGVKCHISMEFTGNCPCLVLRSAPPLNSFVDTRIPRPPFFYSPQDLWHIGTCAHKVPF